LAGLQRKRCVRRLAVCRNGSGAKKLVLRENQNYIWQNNVVTNSQPDRLCNPFILDHGADNILLSSMARRNGSEGNFCVWGYRSPLGFTRRAFVPAIGSFFTC